MFVKEIARKILILANTLLYDGNEWHRLNNLEDMRKMARKVSCKLDETPMTSTISNSWILQHRRSGLEIEVSFAEDGVWVSVFYGIEQMPLVSYEKMKNIDRIYDLIKIVKKAIKKAESDPLIDHLKFEDSLL